MMTIFGSVAGCAWARRSKRWPPASAAATTRQTTTRRSMRRIIAARTRTKNSGSLGGCRCLLIQERRALPARDRQLVHDALNAFRAVRDRRGAGFLRRVGHVAAERHYAVLGIDVNLQPGGLAVAQELGLDRGGDLRIRQRLGGLRGCLVGRLPRLLRTLAHGLAGFLRGGIDRVAGLPGSVHDGVLGLISRVGRLVGRGADRLRTLVSRLVHAARRLIRLGLA